MWFISTLIKVGTFNKGSMLMTYCPSKLNSTKLLQFSTTSMFCIACPLALNDIRFSKSSSEDILDTLFPSILNSSRLVIVLNDLTWVKAL